MGGSQQSKESSHSEDEIYYTANPINEIQILEGHTDIVRCLIKIDHSR